MGGNLPILSPYITYTTRKVRPTYGGDKATSKLCFLLDPEAFYRKTYSKNSAALEPILPSRSAN